jgi:methylated-DNA-[protein]-cysteine S-methyltransferase
MVNIFLDWCVLILDVIGNFTGLGYEAANILIFVIIQPGLIIIFYLLWKSEKKEMNLKGTKFQLKVWSYLKKIPRGNVKTYSQVAKGIGKPLAARAVANAIGKNPLPPKIPCHRVIRSDGSLGGYSGKGGIKTKKMLLKKEGIIL